jgi:uncharacterized membrane protein YhfC
MLREFYFSPNLLWVKHDFSLNLRVIKYGDWKKVEFSKILEVQLHIVSFSQVGRLGHEEATL